MPRCAKARYGKYFLAFCPALLAVCAASAAERRPMPASLTLPQAVNMALTSSPAMRRAEAAHRAGHAGHMLARAANRPNVALVTGQSVRTLNLRANGIDAGTFQGFGNTLIPERFGPFGTFAAQFVMTADVLNLPSRFQQRAARRQAEAGESERGNARELVVLEVAAHYIEALRFQALASTAREQLAAARALATITADRFEQGVVGGLDRRRSRGQVTAAQQAVYEAEAALEAAKLRLAGLLYAEIGANYELADVHRFFRAERTDAADVLRAAMERRPDYLAAKSRVESARMALRAAQSARLPKLAFYADVGQVGRTAAASLTTYTLQGNLTVPIYFGGRGSAEKVRAAAALQEAEAALDAVCSEIELAARVALSAVDSARLQVEAAEETVALAEEEVDLSLLRFQGGVSDNSEVVLAQERLARAKRSRIRALYNLNLSRAALHRATGDAETIYGRSQ